MASLFDPYTAGPLAMKNRFIRSATYTSRADREGRVTPDLLKFYGVLARGEIGAIIAGICYVRTDGKGGGYAIGIDRDELVPGLRELTEAIRADGSRAIFQLHHAGGGAVKAVTGMAPRSASPDRRPRLMQTILGTKVPLSEKDLREIVAAFAQGARRAREAGADGVQLHAAHGYLLSEFLSPYHNLRDDGYGGCDENRYRLLGEVIAAVRAEVGRDYPLWVKMNIDDGTPEPGMTPELAAYYAGRMADDGVDCLEISAGSIFAPFVTCRGEEHADAFGSALPWPLSSYLTRELRKTGRPPLVEAYHGRHAGPVKAALGDVPLALVGGMRTVPAMQDCLDSGTADLIALSRPLIRQPHLINKLKANPETVPTCISCTRCLAACFHDVPIRCYVNGIPKNRRSAGQGTTI